MKRMTSRPIKAIYLFIGLSHLIVSCGPDAKEVASNRFNQAQVLIKKSEFNNAKLILDSIIEEQAEVTEYHAKATELLRTIKIEEQKNNIAYLDSVLAEKQRVLDPLMKNFEIEEAYHKKILTHKRQKTINSYYRTYLRSNLDLDGNYYISSYYCGSANISHTQISAFVGDRQITSENVPFDDFDNRHFDNGANKWEIVNFKDGKDNGIVDLIAQNIAKTIRVQLTGKGNQTITMEQYDKEAIADGYEISFILQEIAKLEAEIANSKKELARIK